MKYAAMILTGMLVFGMALMPTGTADEIEGTYAISATPGLSVTACPGLDEPANFCTGGYIFSADLYDSAPTAMTIADASGGSVDFTICQNWAPEDPDSFCGEEGEPRVSDCGSAADLSESEVDFDAEFATAVFIRLWEPECPDTVATSGTITLTI